MVVYHKLSCCDLNHQILVINDKKFEIKTKQPVLLKVLLKTKIKLNIFNEWYWTEFLLDPPFKLISGKAGIFCKTLAYFDGFIHLCIFTIMDIFMSHHKLAKFSIHGSNWLA